MPYKNPADRNKRQQLRRAAKKSGGTMPLLPAVSSTLPIGDLVGTWAEATLKVPTGPLIGQPFVIPPWQRDWITGALGPGVWESGLSTSRKNGKTGLVSALVLAHLLGPLHRAAWRCVVVSLTGQLASELRMAIEETAEISGLTLNSYRSPLPGHILGPDRSRVDILASDKATGHAIGADLVILDEAGLLQESSRDLWAACYSSISSRKGRMLAISIRGNGPMFDELAQRANTPEVFWQEYAAPEDCDLDDRQAWAAANPGLQSGIKSVEYMVAASARAGANLADARIFRSHDLNQPGNPTAENLIDVAAWTQCEYHVEDLPDRSGRVVLGFDAGGSSSMTALTAIWESGRTECFAAFPSDPDLIARGHADGVGARYQTMFDRGELWAYPGRTTPVGTFLADVAESIQQRPYAVSCDFYRKTDVLDGLQAAGLSNWPIEWRRMGSGPDGSQDVRAFQRLVLDRAISCRESLLVRSALGDSMVRYDPNGNAALDKRRQRGRIDILAAGVLAAGLWERLHNAPERRGYIGLVPNE